MTTLSLILPLTQIKGRAKGKLMATLTLILYFVSFILISSRLKVLF